MKRTNGHIDTRTGNRLARMRIKALGIPYKNDVAAELWNRHLKEFRELIPNDEAIVGIQIDFHSRKATIDIITDKNTRRYYVNFSGGELLGDIIRTARLFGSHSKAGKIAEIVNFWDVPELIELAGYDELEFDRDKKDLRLHLTPDMRWFKKDQKEYEDLDSLINTHKISGNGWTLYTWSDVSGWDYWVNRQGESNYIQITIAFDYSTVNRGELPKIKDAIEETQAKFREYTLEENPADMEACPYY